LRAPLAVLAAAVLLVNGCSSIPAGAPAAASSAPPVKSASGTTVGSIVVLKNYFFNNYKEHCEDWSLTGTGDGFLTYGECKGNPVYFWLFDGPAQRDALMGKIREKNMPLLVSDIWVVAANMDLEPARKDMGGAINP
jgi:hypothetical protein